MATETKKTNAKAETEVKNAKAETEVKKVRIKLEKTRNDKDDVYVAVNGNPYLIKRGEYVEVPESVAEVLQHKEEMLTIAMEFEDQAKGDGASKK